MRLLIAKLTSTSGQSVSVALNSETDIADLATDLDSCLKLLRGGGYDLVLLITSQSRSRSRDAVSRLRREAGRVPMVVLTEPTIGDGATLGGAAALTDDANGHRDDAAWSWRGAELAQDTDWLDRGDRGRRDPGSSRGNDKLGDRASQAITLEGELLHAHGRSVGLSHAEARIFARLWERRGHIVTTQDLLDAVYGDQDRPASRVLPVFLFKLRRKLAGIGLGEMIETAVGRGFLIRARSDVRVREGETSQV